MKLHINKNPKFSPGDWITFYGGTPFKILKIETESNGILNYLLLDQNGHDYFYNKKYVDENARLWTINDAQKDDILTNDFHMIFIFKDIINNTCISSYSVIKRENDVILNSIVETEIGDINLVNFLPATKEQKAILFKRMKEAGYEWNSQKKEFQKINFNEKFKNMIQKTYENMLNTSHKEQKFDVGDWVVSPNGVYWHIDTIQNGRYEVTADTGQCSNWPLDTNIYHLWTIQDVKNGDILVYNNGVVEIILLFKEWKNGYIGAANAYVHIFNNNIMISNWCDCSYAARPATKEQRELLFKRMKKVGYEWDAENKELKRIINEEQIKKNLQDNSFRRMFEQKSAEWSEEDDENLNEALSYIKDDASKEFIKSLKPQNTWKPSDEQVKAFEHFVRSIGESGYASPYENNTKLLYSLLNDLKKLTE